MPTSTAQSARRFLVARQGRSVVIREVTPGTSTVEFGREEAWEHALRLSQPIKSGPNRRPTLDMVFVGLDGSTRPVARPQAQPAAPTTAPAAPEPEPEPAPTPEREPGISQVARANAELIARRNGTELTPELRRVVEDLEQRNLDARLNEFGASLHDQWTRRGRLSERQVAAYTRGMDSLAARRQQPRVQLPDVPKGRYAVDAANGETTFYRIGRSQDGRTFIHLQHGGQESEVPFTSAGYATILQSILDAGLYESAVRYGREIGQCGVCGIRLTNRLSRELGIGPICGGRVHADHDEWLSIRRTAREAIIARGENPDEDVD